MSRPDPTAATHSSISCSILPSSVSVKLRIRLGIQEKAEEAS